MVLLSVFLPIGGTPRVHFLLVFLSQLVAIVGIHALSLVSHFSSKSPSTRARGSKSEAILARRRREYAPPQHEGFRAHSLECGHGCLWEWWELRTLLLLLYTIVEALMMELRTKRSRSIPKLPRHPRWASLLRLEFLPRAANDVDGSWRRSAVAQW